MNRIRFCYVDFWAGRGPWRRINVNQIEDRAKKAKFYNCYTTVQRFESPQPLQNELMWGPLFFDLDSADINTALADAKKLYNYFAGMGIGKEFIHIFFSGKKGFHITIDPEILGVEPHESLSYIMKHAGYFLRDWLKLETLDIQAYSSRRLLRLQDSVHKGTGKYKVELHPHELEIKTEDIIKLATSPRGYLYEDTEYSGIQPHDIALDWWNNLVEEHDNQETLHKLRPRNSINITGKYPDCIKFLLAQTSLPQSNTGNKAVLSLGSYFKDAGKNAEETIDIITKWITTLDNCGDAGKSGLLKPMVEATINCIYEKANEDKYHFACSFIKALGGSGHKIPCAYEKCAMVADPADQEPENPIIVHLSQASKAEYYGHKLTMSVMVAGKDGAPFIIPKEVTARCSKDEKDENCTGCLLNSSEEYSYEFTAKDKEILSLFNSSEEQVGKVIRSKIHSGKCHSLFIDVKSNANVETIRLVPVIDDTRHNAQHHVVRVSHYLGHGIKLNQKYKIEAYTYANPRDQHAVHLISDVTPDNISIDSFKMTPELKKQLSVFQVKPGQKIWHKLDEIHEDLEANIHHIWNRRNMAFGIDLVYHSALQFVFKGHLLPRGWTEVLIVGDSGQGKTMIMEKMRDHYRLGEGASGESSSRTGLIYNFQETQDNWMLQWGRIPLNDRGLLYIDEFSGLSYEDISKMSQLRATGRLTLHGIVSDETSARTRMIFLSNARNGRKLDSFNHGVEAIQTVINAAEDIRRLDFALTVASGEVPIDVLNRYDMPKVDHIYTTFLCEHLILWAWSRSPDDIVFTKEAENKILASSLEMSQKYSSKIPLVEPADQRMKIARLSVAAAARVFSCDEAGEKIIVKPEHVQFVIDYLNSCYSSSSMSYDIFSQEEISRTTMTESVKVDLTNSFMEFEDPKNLKDVLLKTHIITRQYLEDLMGLGGKDSVKILMRYMTSHNLIFQGRRGYYKTPHFITFLKGLNFSPDSNDKIAPGQDKKIGSDLFGGQNSAIDDGQDDSNYS